MATALTTNPLRTRATPYVVALLIVAGAAIGTRLLWGLTYPGALWPLFLVAVAISAWVGGLGPGLTATAASFLAIGGLVLLLGEFSALAPVDVFCVFSLLLVGLFIGMLYSGRERARGALRERDARLKLVSDQIPGGLWSTDDRLRVTSGFGAQSGLLTGPAGTTLYDHFETDSPSFPAIAAHVRALAGEPSTYEFEWGGRTFQSHVEPLRDADGAIIGVVGVASDITDRKRAEEEVQRAKAELEQANKAKDRFLATLSHELRTPLSPVLALSTALVEQVDLPADVRADLEVIRRNAGLEVTLIDDLLDVTRISRGKLQLNFQAVHAMEMLRNAVEICRPDAQAKGVALELEAAPDGPRFVRADGARLQQAFWNLIKNAVKFTPAGGRVSVRAADAPGGRVSIEVRDTGIGIPADVLPRIFDAFEQGTPDITRQFGGLGLGLAITRALVDAHGGRLSAASDGPGRGARFTIELDTVAPARGDAADAVDARDGNGRHLRILLVEDHADTALVMRRLLTGAGHAVETAATVAEAQAKLAATAIDLLISDLGLPDGSGLDVMRDAARRHIRGIALSGFGTEEDVRRSLAAGFAAHLTKPAAMPALRRAIAEAVGAK